MLHEVLLALSGHPSPLFENDELHQNGGVQLLTPAERALLDSLGHLASLHRRLKSHTSTIIKSHASLICRAVASALQTDHLARFQHHILAIEKQVLSADSAHVGAYNTVPLADVVASFADWRRRLEWYLALAYFIVPPDSAASPNSGSATGPALIDRLRQATTTGYPDIEHAATDLTRIAELAWLRLLSSWLLKGSTDGQTDRDFFIHPIGGRDAVVPHLLPAFLSPSVAASIVYVGKTLHQVSASQNPATLGGDLNLMQAPGSSSEMSSRTEYIKLLTHLKLPLSPVDMTNAIGNARSLLAHQLTSTVLPVWKLVELIGTLKDLFLTQRGGFADTLIFQADTYLRGRAGQFQPTSNASNVLAGIIMRDSEAAKVLSNTWASMSAALGIDKTSDPQVEWAREHVQLRIGQRESGESASMGEKGDNPLQHLPKNFFASALLSTPSALTISLKPPLDLFLTRHDIDSYSLINSYLVAIRRSLLHALNLWKQSQLRRGASVGTISRASYKYRAYTSKKVRERACRRERAMRPVWATLTSAIFFLTELGEYLNAEVVNSSWLAFRAWFEGRDFHPRSTHSAAGSRPPTSTTSSEAAKLDTPAFDGWQTRGNTPMARHDPELLSLAHRQYLLTLLETLLLTKEPHTRAIQNLLVRLDHLVANVLRLQTVQSNLDLHDEGVDDGFSEKYAAEEREVYADMMMASDKVKACVRHATEQLKVIDAAAPSLPAMPDERARTGFEPWSRGSVDHLLMRLDLKLSGTAK